MTEEQENGTKLVKLVELAQKHAGYFMGLDGKAYVKMGNKDHCEVFPVNSSSYENWLSTINYKAFGEGRIKQTEIRSGTAHRRCHSDMWESS